MSFIKYKWQLYIPVYTTMVICRLPMSAYTNSVAKVDIFPRSSPTLGEGGGRVTAVVAICLFGHRQLLVYCRHNLSTFSGSASTSCASCTVSNWSSDDALAAPMTDSSRLERGVAADWQGCVVTELSAYDGVYHCLHGAALSTKYATYQIPHADIQCAIDMIDIIIYI